MSPRSATGSARSSTGATSATAEERIAQHRHAAEVLRARSVIVAACLLWLFVGGALDIATHHIIGSGSLAYVLVIRGLASCYHAFALAMLFRRPLPPPRVTTALIESIFPISAIALTAIAVRQGGIASPYVTAIFVILMVQALATPRPWKRGSVLAAATGLVWPVGLLLATLVDAPLRAELHDEVALTTFVIHAAVVGAAMIVVAWGGHVLWSLRQSVFESRNIGRYRLVRRIGKGGMGEVWRAFDRALRRDVALKILSPEHGRNPSAIARFEREIEATAAITHPNVVRVHDWGVTDDGVWYYAMELLEGVDLSTLIKRGGPLPAALVVHLGAEAAAGLAEAHRRGTIHRDIKPGNVFVIAPAGEPDHAVILDFGIARLGDDDGGLTQAGAVMGTPGFMAPEVVAGAPGGIAADVYGLAATLFHALTGKNPRDAATVTPSQLVPTIPAALDDVLVRALDADPGRRHASADDLAHELATTGLVWSGSWPIERLGPTPPLHPAHDATLDADAPVTRSQRASRAAP